MSSQAHLGLLLNGILIIIVNLSSVTLALKVVDRMTLSNVATLNDLLKKVEQKQSKFNLAYKIVCHSLSGIG